MMLHNQILLRNTQKMKKKEEITSLGQAVWCNHRLHDKLSHGILYDVKQKFLFISSSEALLVM